LQLPVKQRKEL